MHRFVYGGTLFCEGKLIALGYDCRSTGDGQAQFCLIALMYYNLPNLHTHTHTCYINDAFVKRVRPFSIKFVESVEVKCFVFTCIYTDKDASSS